MPIRRLSLSRAQLGRHRSAAQRLRASGLDVEIPEELQEDARAMDIHIAPPHINIVRQLSNGTVAYVIWVQLVALWARVILQDFRLAAAWDPDLMPLTDDGKGLYSFQKGFDYSRGEVLNHRLERPLFLHHRGDLVEGLLLATGLEPIPDAYQNSMGVLLEVSFMDQFKNDHPARAYAFVERSARQKARGLRRETSSGLYEPLMHGIRDAIDKRNGVVTLQVGDKVSTEAPAVHGSAQQALVDEF
jgi:hypothetical protein